MFGALALYGSMTKRSLVGLGQFAFMGLIGIVIASVVGLFWQNDTLQFMISAIGVIVFAGLTAYDAQRLKAMALSRGAASGVVRQWRGARAIPRLHESLLDDPAAVRQPALTRPG